MQAPTGQSERGSVWERSSRLPGSGLLFARRSQDPKQCDGIEDQEMRILRAEAFVLHQVEKVVVPGDKMIGIDGDGEVEIRLIVRVTGRRECAGNVGKPIERIDSNSRRPYEQTHR
jgi:hypothetical protein